jgi:hypothetical protein
VLDRRSRSNGYDGGGVDSRGPRMTDRLALLLLCSAGVAATAASAEALTIKPSGEVIVTQPY